jgi:hypothetical protein
LLAAESAEQAEVTHQYSSASEAFAHSLSDVVLWYNIKQAIPKVQRERSIKPGQSQFATPFL